MEFCIKGFELLEADGSGVSDLSCGFMSQQKDADAWAARSTRYRRVRPYEKLIIVHDSLESLDAFEREQVKVRALAKLTKEEREALGY